MKENTEEKSIVKVDENSLFYKIKQFFKKLFHKSEITQKYYIPEITDCIRKDENKRNAFIEELKKIENEETALLKLQKKYRSGEIKEEELTKEQIDSLCKLYDKQIADLRKANEQKKQRLAGYKKGLSNNN